MSAYILHVVLFQLLFLLVYELLLKKETFFTWNRWYLLATAVASLLLPFIEIEMLSFWLPAENISQLPINWFTIEGTEAAATTEIAASSTFNCFRFKHQLVVHYVCGRSTDKPSFFAEKIQ
jgi:bla regulator protein blaR1